MKKLVLASVSALALFGVAACSDSTDATTTQGVPETQMNEPAPVDPAMPAAPPAIDDSTTQSIEPAPAPDAPMEPDTMQPVPVE